MPSLEQMKAAVTRCVVEAWREQHSVTGAVNEIMGLIETAINARTQEVKEMIDSMSWETSMEELKGSVFNTHHYVRVKHVNAKLLKRKSDIIHALSPEVKDDSK